MVGERSTAITYKRNQQGPEEVISFAIPPPKDLILGNVFTSMILMLLGVTKPSHMILRDLNWLVTRVISHYLLRAVYLDIFRRGDNDDLMPNSFLLKEDNKLEGLIQQNYSSIEVFDHFEEFPPSILDELFLRVIPQGKITLLDTKSNREHLSKLNFQMINENFQVSLEKDPKKVSPLHQAISFSEKEIIYRLDPESTQERILESGQIFVFKKVVQNSKTPVSKILQEIFISQNDQQINDHSQHHNSQTRKTKRKKSTKGDQNQQQQQPKKKETSKQREIKMNVEVDDEESEEGSDQDEEQDEDYEEETGKRSPKRNKIEKKVEIVDLTGEEHCYWSNIQENVSKLENMLKLPPGSYRIVIKDSNDNLIQFQQVNQNNFFCNMSQNDVSRSIQLYRSHLENKVDVLWDLQDVNIVNQDRFLFVIKNFLSVEQLDWLTGYLEDHSNDFVEDPDGGSSLTLEDESHPDIQRLKLKLFEYIGLGIKYDMLESIQVSEHFFLIYSSSH